MIDQATIKLNAAIEAAARKMAERDTRYIGILNEVAALRKRYERVIGWQDKVEDLKREIGQINIHINKLNVTISKHASEIEGYVRNRAKIQKKLTKRRDQLRYRAFINIRDKAESPNENPIRIQPSQEPAREAGGAGADTGGAKVHLNGGDIVQVSQESAAPGQGAEAH